VIVVDSSAWIELFRATGSRIDRTLTRLLQEEADVAVTEVVIMEVLVGARSPEQLEQLHARFLAYPVLPLHGVDDYVDAANLHRACRRAGETIGKTTDCLVAVPAIRAEARVLAADRDFETLARHTALRLMALDV
jgi:predicted nucleic acid-binding protein